MESAAFDFGESGIVVGAERRVVEVRFAVVGDFKAVRARGSSITV